MARGWESKDVESQIEDSPVERRSSADPCLSSEELWLIRERDSLTLQRARIVEDLKSAANRGYREILQRSLDFLDEKLASLQKPKHS
jgi:hypothetical protein